MLGLAAAAALLLAPFAALADIFKYVDKSGHVYLTDKPDHAGYKLLVKTWKGWVERGARGSGRIDYRRAEVNRRRFGPTIAKAAKQYRLPDALLHAVIKAESYYDPNAISTAGAVGLMQLMPATAQRYGVRDRRDPTANIQGGSRYLRDLLQMFDNNLVLAIAAYNAGEGAVIEHGYKIPPYAETRGYVRKVLQFYRQNRQPVKGANS